jgi:hypothetical protein
LTNRREYWPQFVVQSFSQLDICARPLLSLNSFVIARFSRPKSSWGFLFVATACNTAVRCEARVPQTPTREGGSGDSRSLLPSLLRLSSLLLRPGAKGRDIHLFFCPPSRPACVSSLVLNRESRPPSRAGCRVLTCQIAFGNLHTPAPWTTLD